MGESATVDLILGEQTHLRQVARRLARCDADIDDLVQDTLLRAYRARERFQAGTSIRAWTTTILRRLFLSDVARFKRRRADNDTDAGEPLERAPGPERPASLDEASLLPDVEELDDRVKRALGRVPNVYRRCFCLATFADMSCAEISARLHVPQGTVMSRVHRARERLRWELTGGFDAPVTRGTAQRTR